MPFYRKIRNDIREFPSLFVKRKSGDHVNEIEDLMKYNILLLLLWSKLTYTTEKKVYLFREDV